MIIVMPKCVIAHYMILPNLTRSAVSPGVNAGDLSLVFL